MSANYGKEVWTVRFDERKQKILSAIIETYIKTGEPVGSKTLSEMPGIGVSPATIRNEMAALFRWAFWNSPTPLQEEFLPTSDTVFI